MAETEGLKVGDRIEYPGHLKFQLGAERQNEQGEVVDIIASETGRVQLVFSKPDSYVALRNEGETVRMDYVLADEPNPPVRKVDG